MGYFTDTEFDSPLDMLDAINEVVERNIRQCFERVSGTQVGLDQRVGTVYINQQDRVIASRDQRSLDYYGGFEYIKEGEGRMTVGDWTFYQGGCEGESDRVNDCFDHYESEEVEEDAE